MELSGASHSLGTTALEHKCICYGLLFPYMEASLPGIQAVDHFGAAMGCSNLFMPETEAFQPTLAEPHSL